MKDLLITLRVLDDDGRLSLTSLAVMAALFVVIRGGSIDSVVALLAALGNYAHKRYVRSQLPPPAPQAKEIADAHTVIATVENLRAELGDLRDNLNTVKLAIGFNPKGK